MLFLGSLISRFNQESYIESLKHTITSLGDLCSLSSFCPVTLHEMHLSVLHTAFLSLPVLGLFIIEWRIFLLLPLFKIYNQHI